MSEDLFANPHSQIPDELWKTPSPMERQLAAVEYWAELTHPEKSAAAPMAHALGSLAGGALGAGAGYLSSDDPEKRKKRALIGGGIGAVGGGLAPLLMRRPPDELFDPAPDLPFQSAAKRTMRSAYQPPSSSYRKLVETEFDDLLSQARGYEAGLEQLKRYDITEKQLADAINRMGGTHDVMAAPFFRATIRGEGADGQLSDVAASIARRPEYADVLANMEDTGATPSDFLEDLARAIARRDTQAAFGKTASADGLSTTTKLVDFFRTRKGNAALAAGGAAILTGGHAVITGRKDQMGRTAAQRKWLEEDAAFSARDEMSGQPKKRRVHELKRRIVNAHARHPVLYPAGSAVLGGLMVGGLKYRLSKGKLP